MPNRGGYASSIVSHLAGYMTPPLLGLGGVALVNRGLAWSLLWVTLVLLLGAWSQFRGLYTGLILLLAGAGVAYVVIAGSPFLQETVAVALVWLLLLGGVRAVAVMSIGPTSDSGRLQDLTWITAFLWAGLFWFVAIVCLWVGARRLTGL